MTDAWANLVNSDGSDAHLELCNAALVEIQAETRRRAAARIKRDVDAGEFGPGLDDGAWAAAEAMENWE